MVIENEAQILIIIGNLGRTSAIWLDILNP